MESFNYSNDKSKRTIAPGMPPLPPTSQRMKGRSSSNPNIDPRKLKRMLARQYAQTYRNKQTCLIMQLERTVQSLEANVQTASAMMCRLARQCHSFQVENGNLRRKLSFFSQEIESKEAERGKLMKERDKLKRAYVEQLQNYEELLRSNMASAQFVDMGQPGRPTYV